MMVLLLCLNFALAATGSQEPNAGNYYDTLNVERTAALSQIKKAFRTMALKYHPDRNEDAKAEVRFREINEAYKVLSSSKDRKLYDRLGHEAFVRTVSGVPQNQQERDFDDIFHFSEDDLFEMDADFMWTFSEDGDHHWFHSDEFTYV